MSDTQHSSEAPVHIVPYNPDWPAMFERERVILQRTIAPWIAGPIEHIGSTAMPGMFAKPVIDIMVAVQSLAGSRGAMIPLTKVGYHYFPYRPDVMHWFCKPSPSFRTHHLHLVPHQSKLWNDRIAFRDYLRRDPAIAAEYVELKRRLAAQFKFDREAYTNAKEPFIRRVVALAATRL